MYSPKKRDADPRITTALAPIQATLPWRQKTFERILKRLLDLAIAAPLVLILSPVMLTTAILVRLTSQGPILLKQIRLGLDGVPFEMSKFRSMVADLPDGSAQGAGEVGRTDAQLTPIGGWLRAWRLDELPQLWHVLIGEMSLVGPRPDSPSNLDLYQQEQWIRFGMPSGCTTWAFVRGAFEHDWSERQSINTEYVLKWSFALDLKIMLQSALVLLLQKNTSPETSAQLPFQASGGE